MTQINAWTGSPITDPVPVLPKLFVAGHSIAAGSSPLLSASNRITTKLAQQLGATETNLAAASAGMLAANDAAHAPSKLSTGGNWPSVGQNFTLARTAAPYCSSLVVVDLMWGINDIAQYGPANAAFLANWKSVLFALVAYLRSGAIKMWNDASITYGGLGAWNSLASTNQNMGGGLEWNATNGGTVTFPVPADYDGQAINLFAITGGESATCDSARYTTTVGGVQVAQQSSAGINIASGAGPLFQSQPFCVRLPNSVTGLVPGGGTAPSVVTTVDQVVNHGWFNCWAIEASPPPLIILADTLRSPAGYSAYSTWPYTPTDADVTALNAANAQVAAMFTDGMVITDGADAIVAKGGNASDWGNVHPLARICGQVAGIQRSKIATALQPVLATLGELGTA